MVSADGDAQERRCCFLVATHAAAAIGPKLLSALYELSLPALDAHKQGRRAQNSALLKPKPPLKITAAISVDRGGLQPCAKVTISIVRTSNCTMRNSKR